MDLVRKSARLKSAMKLGKNVLHYTMELNECYVGLRYDSCFTGIPFQDIIEHEEMAHIRTKKRCTIQQ